MTKQLTSQNALQFVTTHGQRLQMISGRALLVGCDVACIEFLSGPQFDLNVFAVDRDMADVEACKGRTSFMANDSLPFEADYFSVIVWAEGKKLGSASPTERAVIFAEFERVIRLGGTTLVCVDFASTDQTIEYWAEELDADQVEYDCRPKLA